MSSYQFVNSLASCYAGQQAQQQPRATANSPGEPMQAASPAGGDYYNPNAAATSYPAPCYSPQQHYPQHPYATPASGMQHTAPTGMIDYTQLQPQPRLSATATSQQHSMHQQSQHHPQQHHPQQQLHQDPTTPLLQAASAPSAPSTSSCKYADSTSSTSVASPQDLTTSTSRNSPTPLVAPGTSKAASGLTSPPGSSSRSSVAASAASPASGSSRPVAEGSSTLTTASSASSPASSTSSTSSTGNNTSNKTNPTGNEPPKIYSWMKRVHIGQSELAQIAARIGPKGSGLSDWKARTPVLVQSLGNYCKTDRPSIAKNQSRFPLFGSAHSKRSLSSVVPEFAPPTTRTRVLRPRSPEESSDFPASAASRVSQKRETCLESRPTSCNPKISENSISYAAFVSLRESWLLFEDTRRKSVQRGLGALTAAREGELWSRKPMEKRYERVLF
ncbi:uncharacterized protein LOC143220773 [Lasioglossum baleicum]|uniref:uncharacterized protein LOC143220773 n=1 Tax=Lasioglossum baleicum TaxID=434251 RepID=UPI003FCDE88C